MTDWHTPYRRMQLKVVAFVLGLGIVIQIVKFIGFLIRRLIGLGAVGAAAVVGGVVLLVLVISLLRRVFRKRRPEGPLPPAHSLMHEEQALLSVPAFYLGPQPLSPYGAPMTDLSLVHLALTRQTIGVLMLENRAQSPVLLITDGVRVRFRPMSSSHAGPHHAGRYWEAPAIILAHPSLLRREPATTETGYWADTPAELEAYAEEVAAELGLPRQELAEALLRGDSRRLAALNAWSDGYLGEMVPGPGGGEVFRAPEMRLVIADPDRPDVPAAEAVVGEVLLAVQQALHR